MRGFHAAIYVDDQGRQWRLSVDEDSYADLNRGWVDAEGTSLVWFPRGWLPRRVVGVDPTGRTLFARVATVDAPLWTGTVSTWLAETSDRALTLVTRVASQGERTQL